MLGRLKFNLDTLVEEMLDRIPEEMFVSDTTTFLDPAMGGGQFIKGLISRLRKYSHSDDNIASRITGYENNKMRIQFAVNKYNLIGTFEAKDFLEEEYEEDEDMKFDVILGNPPFQDPKKPRHKLWTKFVKKSVGMATYVAMVTPKLVTQMLNGFEVDHTKFDNKVYVHSIALAGVDDHFNEGSDFSWFVISESEKNMTMQVMGNEQPENWKSGTFIPYKPDAMMASIISKTMNFENNYNRCASRIGEDESGNFKGIEKFLAAGIVWKNVNKTHKNQDKLKMLYPTLGTGEYLDYIGNVMPTTSFTVYVTADNETELKTFPLVQETNIFKYLEFCFISRRSPRDYVWANITKLKSLDTTALYEQFGLTQEERTHIESHVK